MPISRKLRLAALLALLGSAAAAEDAKLPAKVQDAIDRFEAERDGLRAAFDKRPPRDEKTWVLKKLDELSAIDALMRRDTSIPFKEAWGEADKNAFNDAYWKKFQETGFANAKELDGMFKRYGWIQASKFGDRASEEAWQLVRHADQDLPFQKAVLERLRKLASRRDRARFAELTDHIAVAENRPQSYGTQGDCKGSGKWEPSPIDDADHLDARRGEAGLEPFDSFKAEKEKSCP